MALTAREWLLLPDEEQERRKNELSLHECYMLRADLSHIHFTEEEKAAMTEQQKYEFTHPRIYSDDEKQEFNKKAEAIFIRLANEVKKA